VEYGSTAATKRNLERGRAAATDVRLVQKRRVIGCHNLHGKNLPCERINYLKVGESGKGDAKPRERDA
jgi:hypothetical protein